MSGAGVAWLGIGATGTSLAGTAAGFAVAAAGGALSGYIMTGTLEGALWGAFSGMAFFAIGTEFAGTAGNNGVLGSSYTGPELVRASVAHGVAGGTISKLQGGRFGHGFLSAGLSKLSSPAIHTSGANRFSQVAMATVVGGSVSSITGGKFANGAVTAAMGYAFNQLTQVPEAEAYEEHSSGRTRTTFVEPDYSVAPKISWLGVDDLDWLMIADASLAGPLLRTRIPLPDLQIATERGEYLLSLS